MVMRISTKMRMLKCSNNLPTVCFCPVTTSPHETALDGLGSECPFTVQYREFGRENANLGF